MEKKDTFTKILAIAGTVLVWLPLLAPVVFSLLLLFRAHIFRFDYLMPAELFPLVLLGGGLLIWAATRARSWLRVIGGSMLAAVVLLAGSMVVAQVSGLASGAIEPAGIWWVITLAGIILFILALVVTAIGGILLLRNLFSHSGWMKNNLQVH